MIEVFRMVHKYYDINAAAILNFNIFSTTGGNKYKLQKIQAIINNLRKYSFSSRIVNISNSLPDRPTVVDADTINTFKSRLDKHWLNQDVVYNFYAELSLLSSLRCRVDSERGAARMTSWYVSRLLFVRLLLHSTHVAIFFDLENAYDTTWY